ncbi:hypothetical protein PspKH34_17120 [Parageobacillus sp. KH3-4]|nr:hypothetical protein PspKH34_17120 [Parageobacillus sp. KH3-4]
MSLKHVLFVREESIDEKDIIIHDDVFMAGCKLGELESPKPILTVDGKEMDYKIATYSWAENGHAIDANAVAPPYLVENMDFNVVPADAKLLIRFRYQPADMEAGIWKNDRVHFERVMNNTVILPKGSGSFIYVIHASWEEGNAIYAIPIKVK